VQAWLDGLTDGLALVMALAGAAALDELPGVAAIVDHATRASR
jgi:hypothetical protein